METGNSDEQKRKFALTQSKLLHMKPDPSVSIDAFISKMLTTPTTRPKPQQNIAFSDRLPNPVQLPPLKVLAQSSFHLLSY